MAFNFDLTSTQAWNDMNPCCCPYENCPPPILTAQYRDNQSCRSGYSPNFKIYPTSGDPQRPNAFDLRVANEYIPVYQTQTITFQTTRAGTKVLAAVRHNGEKEQIGQSQVTATASFFGESYTETKYNTLPHQMPASDRSAAGTCPPYNGVSVTSPPSGLTLQLLPGTPTGWTVPKFSWNDNRPNDPNGTTPEEKLGTYNLNVNGSVYNIAANEITLPSGIPPNGSYCVQARIRLTIGDGSSAWTEAQWFRRSADTDPCCTSQWQSPNWPECNTGFATGNPQWSTTPIERGRQLGIWKLTWSDAGESGSYSDYFGCPRQSGEDPKPGDDPNTNFQNPAGLSIEPPQLALNQTFNQTVEWTPDQYKDTQLRTSIYDLSQPANSETPGWAGTTNSQSFALTQVEIQKKSEDQNTSGVLTSLETQARANIIGFENDERWGLTLSGGIPGKLTGALARAVSWRPRTDGSGSSGAGAGAGNQVYAKIRQARYRWEVPRGFNGVGNTYSVRWSIGRFSHRWIKWRGEYFIWAQKKYDFLHKPQPGDDDYPKRSDYPSGESGDSAYQAAIDAINDIEDPGAAPEEPAGHEPVVVAGPFEWSWTSDQGESALVELDECATGYPRYPLEPKRDDYPPGPEGTEDFTEDHQEWQEEMAILRLRTTRQSSWYLNTPARYSLDMDLPIKPADLPTTPPPTQAQVEAHNRAMTAYNNRTVWYNAAQQDDYVVCDVTYSCGMTPAGPLMFSDTRFATTTLPVLDPTNRNPDRYSEWFS